MAPGVKIQWKGYLILFACIILSPSNGLMMLGDVRNVHDLCRANRHLYEMSENSSFELHLRSDAKSSGRDKMALKKLKTKCALTLKVCSSCHVGVVIKNMNIPSCSGNCSCNYFEITEPLSSYSSAKFCGQKEDVSYIESKTKILYLNFVQSVHEKFYVSFYFSVKRNVFFYTEHISSVPKYIETPYFPASYPSDYEAEYVFQILSPFGYIELLFIDFQLSEGSYIEVSGHNGTRVDVFDGTVFRPPVIVSHNKFLRVRFQANDQPASLGFRAMYRYGLDIGDYPLVKPRIDCGGNKEGYGGTIELNIPLSREELFDCIWLISPPLFSHQHSFLAASVSKFRNISPGSSLEFRKGLTSKSELVKFKQCHYSKNCSLELENSEVIAQAKNGFYIRFRGYLGRSSYLLIAYYKFKEENCSKSDFVCQNGKKCLNSALVCDGYNHCIDGSDEMNCLAAVNYTDASQSDRTGESLIIKKHIYISDDSTFIIFASLGCCGMFLFLIIVIIVVYNNHKDNERRVSRSQNQRRRNAVVFAHDSPAENVESVLPPASSMDDPPSYEEVLTCNERYPPLFYTRSKQTVETCFDAKFCQPIFPHELPPRITSSPLVNTVSSSETIAINIHYGSSRDEINYLGTTSKLIKSSSLDCGLESRFLKRCKCKLSVLFSDVHHPGCSTLFRSFPCGFRIHSQAVMGTYCQSHLINREFSNCAQRSFCNTFPVHSTELPSFSGKSFWSLHMRTKAYSF